MHSTLTLERCQPGWLVGLRTATPFRHPGSPPPPAARCQVTDNEECSMKAVGSGPNENTACKRYDQGITVAGCTKATPGRMQPHMLVSVCKASFYCASLRSPDQKTTPRREGSAAQKHQRITGARKAFNAIQQLLCCHRWGQLAQQQLGHLQIDNCCSKSHLPGSPVWRPTLMLM